MDEFKYQWETLYGTVQIEKDSTKIWISKSVWWKPWTWRTGKWVDIHGMISDRLKEATQRLQKDATDFIYN